MELKCVVQKYDWGKKGFNSKVAQLVSNIDENFNVEDNIPYAELWMGTHINGPSVIKQNLEPLSDILKAHPEYLGNELSNEVGDLPFLFKVLSIDKALSIQAHPSKQHAKELHSKFPNIYKDPNHKPELAIALTPFEALCGFREVDEIRAFCSEINELNSITGCASNQCDNTEFLKNSFYMVLTCDKSIMQSAINSFLERISVADEELKNKYLFTLVERLHNQFPYDNGIFMAYFLNYIKLEPSQAIYLAANEPHAYLSGDCIECMACSDNVVRAGLTPKLVDVETLCSMLNYVGEKPENKLFHPEKENQFSNIFQPPVPDFAVVEMQVPKSDEAYKITPRNSASILLVISGGGLYEDLTLKPGRVVFIPAGTALLINVTEDLVMYQALANV